ncbi:MAG: hypothetical protein WCC04_20795 [Terriglobales bacterium]
MGRKGLVCCDAEVAGLLGDGCAFLGNHTLGRRSEISYRVENALTWFGDSAFESAAGTQIVNFVAALERLTTTEAFSTHKFCSRVAILACEKDEDFEKTYWSPLRCIRPEVQ